MVYVMIFLCLGILLSPKRNNLDKTFEGGLVKEVKEFGIWLEYFFRFDFPLSVYHYVF